MEAIPVLDLREGFMCPLGNATALRIVAMRAPHKNVGAGQGGSFASVQAPACCVVA